MFATLIITSTLLGFAFFLLAFFPSDQTWAMHADAKKTWWTLFLASVTAWSMFLAIMLITADLWWFVPLVAFLLASYWSGRGLRSWERIQKLFATPLPESTPTPALQADLDQFVMANFGVLMHRRPGRRDCVVADRQVAGPTSLTELNKLAEEHVCSPAA